jgi:hypothetical protein
MEDSSDSVQISIKLGFDFLTYHYHHLVVCLTRSDESCRDVCLNSARAAISLLKDLVAHSEEVFNGIIWYVRIERHLPCDLGPDISRLSRQLLYYPFTPFFVLFGEVVTNPRSKTCMEDLQLLRQTVLYYLQFQKYHSSAVKLERVAETFTKIAEAFVRHTFRRRSEISAIATSPNDLVAGGRSRRHPGHSNRSSRPLPAPSSTSPSAQIVHKAVPASSRPVEPAMPPDAHDSTLPDPMDYQLHLDEAASLDPTYLFHLFSYSTTGDQGPVMHDADIGWPNNPQDFASSIQHDNDGNENRVEELPPDLGSGKYVSMRDVEINGRNQFSNCTFDWLALENGNI